MLTAPYHSINPIILKKELTNFEDSKEHLNDYYCRARKLLDEFGGLAAIETRTAQNTETN